MVLPLVGGVVMTLIPHCEHHHTTTRGFVETVNWNLNGAQIFSLSFSGTLPMIEQ
jgi:hypothetical protein